MSGRLVGALDLRGASGSPPKTWRARHPLETATPIADAAWGAWAGAPLVAREVAFLAGLLIEADAELARSLLDDLRRRAWDQ